MKYLKKFSLFLENYDIKDTDPEDVKLAKEKLNDLGKQITEYGQKKAQITSIYNKAETISETGEEIRKIIGEGEESNKFLVKWNTISRIEKEIDLVHQEIVEDKIKLDDLDQEAKALKDSETKATAVAKVKDMMERIKDKNQKIVDKTKEFSDLEKEHLKEMEQERQDLRNYITKISNTEAERE